MALEYLKPTPITLKGNSTFSERWLQERICEDTSILGLGELEVKDVERMQPHAGRLDLLLHNRDTGKRYEVELMLGVVDESHIIRTVEYWDIERRRYPQYDHCAVIVAEKITARFLNVIGLFNSAIPIIALQLSAFQIGENGVILTFAKVLDEVVRGEDDEDESSQSVSRDYWEQRASRMSLDMVDRCLTILRKIGAEVELRYTKFYIGLTENDAANNFVAFVPKRQFLRIEANKLLDPEEWKSRIEKAGLVLLGGPSFGERVIFRVTEEELNQHEDIIEEIFRACRQEESGV
jgi:hypothetical protein